MGVSMPELANIIWADGPSSMPTQPNKHQIRQWGSWLEGIITAFTTNGGLIYSSRSALFADLTKPANSMAWVFGDPVAANNGVYGKVGNSGTGSWTRRTNLPFSFIVASDAGAGAPNAIQATTSIPVSPSALIWLEIAKTNGAGPTTVQFNSDSLAAYTIKTSSGKDPVAGGLKAGMIILGIVSGLTFRLVSDQASDAIIATAEAAAVRAEAAAAGVPSMTAVSRDANRAAWAGNISPVTGASNDMSIIIDNYGDWNNVTQTGTAPLRHEHFGDGVELPNGWLAKFQRSAMGHGQENSWITDIYSKNVGGSWGGYRTVFPAQPGIDLRGALVAVLPSGTIVVCTSAVSLSANYSEPYDPTPTKFQIGYIRNYRQANEEIVPLQTFYTHPYQYAQIRNVSVAPGINGNYVIEIGGFRATMGVDEDGKPQQQLEVFTFLGAIDEVSDTVTNLQLGTPIFSGVNTLGLTEDARVRKTANKGLAVIRSGSGLQQFKLDNGVWTHQGTLPDTISNDVAPTLTLRRIDGIDYVVLAYNRRTGSQDRMRFRWARFDDVFADQTKWYGLYDPLPYDYQNASGYQSIVQLRSGRVLMFTHKEYNAGTAAGQFTTGDNPGPTQVRMHNVELDRWVRNENPWLPTIVAATPGSTPTTYAEQSGMAFMSGDSVTITATVQASNWTSTGASGAVSISNLPVPVRNLRSCRSTCSVVAINVRLADATVTIGGSSVSVHCDDIVALLNNATGNIDLYKKTPNGIVALTAAELQANASFILSLTYQRVPGN